MKALNRKEVLVNAKANGTLDSFKPLTRDEAFTKKALGLGGGGSGGGGGQSGKITVTFENNDYERPILDKSYSEIKTMIDNGVLPWIDNYGMIFYYYHTSGTGINEQMWFYYMYGDGSYLNYVLKKDGTISKKNGYSTSLYIESNDSNIYALSIENGELKIEKV